MTRRQALRPARASRPMLASGVLGQRAYLAGADPGEVRACVLDCLLAFDRVAAPAKGT